REPRAARVGEPHVPKTERHVDVVEWADGSRQRPFDDVRPRVKSHLPEARARVGEDGGEPMRRFRAGRAGTGGERGAAAGESVGAGGEGAAERKLGPPGPSGLPFDVRGGGPSVNGSIPAHHGVPTELVGDFGGVGEPGAISEESCVEDRRVVWYERRRRG